MLNPKYQRYADRLRELIEDGQTVAKLERKYDGVSWPYIREHDGLHEWYTKAMNILSIAFGKIASIF